MSVTQTSLKKSEKMTMPRTLNLTRIGWPILGMALLAVTGCHDEVGEFGGPEKQILPPAEKVAQGNPPGLPVAMGSAPEIQTVLNSYVTVNRPNPWQLHDDEAGYDVKAKNERIFAQTGGFFPPSFVPKIETVQVDEVERQPFRRLAGVLVGDSVMAIIDMGDGSPMQVIRPGMQIPNSPWKVMSIDESNAVLHRNGTKRPKDVVVRLQGPAVSSGGGFAPGGGGGGRRTNPAQPPGGDQGVPTRPGGRQIAGGGGGIS